MILPRFGKVNRGKMRVQNVSFSEKGAVEASRLNGGPGFFLEQHDGFDFD